MIRRVLLVLALLVAVPAHAALDVDFGRYYALVIGINDYENLPRLKTAVNDARAVAEVLEEKYGFEVTLLINPGRSKVIRAIDRLRGELTERDNLLIYYAGHGVLDVEADAGYWMSVDAEEDTQVDWISVATVTSTVKAMSAKHVMVVSDSCYSGRLTRGVSALVKTGSERVAELRRLAAKRSHTALVSGGLEPVLDGGGGDHSVFTRAFLTALRESDEVLDGNQLFTSVRGAVIVNALQTPEYSDIQLAGHDGGDFLFVPVSLGEEVAVEAPAAPSASDSEIELTYWNSVKDSDSAAVIGAYLEAYPEGLFAALARVRINELESREKRRGEEQAASEAAAAAAAAREHEQELWQSVKDSEDASLLQLYLAKYPEGTFADAAAARLLQVEARREASAAEVARAVRERAQWELVKDSDDAARVAAFLGEFPNGTFASLARSRIELLGQRAARAEAAPSAPSAETTELASLQSPAEPSPSTAAPAGPYGGDWVGLAKKSSGDGHCPRTAEIRVTVSNEDVRGSISENGDTVEFTGKIDAKGRLKTKGSIFFDGHQARLVGTFSDGGFRGRLVSEDCRLAFEIAPPQPSADSSQQASLAEQPASTAALAGPYDGEWAGSAKKASGWRDCPGTVRLQLTVSDDDVKGSMTSEGETDAFTGKIEDGRLRTKIIGGDTVKLQGKFADDQFSGTLSEGGDCRWRFKIARVAD